MAIAGLIVLAMDGELEAVTARLSEVENLSFYGPAPENALVYVLEAPSNQLEDRLRAIQKVPGVVSVLPTSVNIEDELEAGGGFAVNGEGATQAGKGA